jgi:hypothetical protein
MSKRTARTKVPGLQCWKATAYYYEFDCTALNADDYKDVVLRIYVLPDAMLARVVPVKDGWTRGDRDGLYTATPVNTDEEVAALAREFLDDNHWLKDL